MDNLYAAAEAKLKQMESDGVDMIQYQNEVRQKLISKLGQMGSQYGVGDGSIESLMMNTIGSNPDMKLKLENGLKRQKEITNDLIPWLQANNFKFTNPTTMGIFFISGTGTTRISICKETENIYDVEIYINTISRDPYINKSMGYNKSKKFTTEGLKEELLKLREFIPS